MPNHVTTELKAPKYVLDALISHEVPELDVPKWIPDEKRENWIIEHQARNQEFAERGYVDFGLLIPPPPNIEKGGCSGDHPPGVVCWYEWNISHWGTKWNGYETERPNETTLRFDTAWSHPLPVMEALAEKFPNERITVAFADEDLGQNVASYVIADGKAELTSPEGWEGSDEARDFAARLKYGKSYAELSSEWEDE